MTSGEQWAAEQLGALRADRFTVGAWTRFLVASLERAGATRRERPQLASQARRWSILGFGADLVARAWAPRGGISTPRLRSFVPWWLTISAMLDWHLGMVEGPAGERRERLSAADALTLQRLWAVPLVVAQRDPTNGSGKAFSALVTSAAVGDALDGLLARRAGTTRLGRDLDKASDAIVVSAAAYTAGRAGWLPAPVARLAIARNALPVTYVAASYFGTGRRPEIDSLGPGRRLAPALLGGLAVAPLNRRTGAALTSAASVAALVLAVPPRVSSDGEMVRAPSVAPVAGSGRPSSAAFEDHPRRETRSAHRDETGLATRHRNARISGPPDHESVPY